MENVLLYRILRKKSRRWYRTIGEIFSPALGQNIRFTATGFNHLIFKHPRWRRTLSAQIARFNVLPHAVKLVGLSTTYQEFEVVPFKKMTYWGIIAVIDGQKIKVVLRRIDHGRIHFWSVFSQWTTSKRRDEKLFADSGRSKTPH